MVRFGHLDEEKGVLEGKEASEAVEQLEEEDSEDGLEVIEYESLRELLLPLYVPTVLGHSMRLVTMTALPLDLLNSGISYDNLGLLVTINGAGVALGNLPAGMYTTRFGPRSAIQCSSWMFFVAALLTASADSFEEYRFYAYLLAFLLTGLADSFGVLGRQVFMGCTTRGSLTNYASSTQGGVARVAATVAPVLGGAMAQHFGTISVYALQSLMAVACVVAAGMLMPRVHSAQDLAGKLPSQTKSPKVLPSQAYEVSYIAVLRKHWGLLARAVVFVAGAFFVRRARELIFALEGHARSMSQGAVGTLAAVSSSVDFCLFPAAGWLMSEFGKTRVGGVFFFLMTCSFLVLQSRTSGDIWIFAILSGISNGISSGLALSFGAQLAPPECRSHFLAIFRLLARCGDPSASELIGVVSSTGSLALAELLVAMVSLAVAFFGMLFVPEPGANSKHVAGKESSNTPQRSCWHLIGASRHSYTAPTEQQLGEGETDRIPSNTASNTVSDIGVGATKIGAGSTEASTPNDDGGKRNPDERTLRFHT